MGRFTPISGIEDLTVTVKCRTTIKAMFRQFNLCLSVKDG